MKPAKPHNHVAPLFVAVMLLSFSAAAQAQPSFEVASVKSSVPPGVGRSSGYAMGGGPGTRDPVRFTCENFDLASLIMLAYNIRPYELSTPAWMHEAKFDIVANVPDGATREQFRLMLQNLLTERFQLKARRDTRTMPVYVLLIAKKGPKLRENRADTPVTKVVSTGREVQMTFTSASMERLAMQISGVPEVGRPVLDRTGLTGTYDFQLNLAGASRGGPDPDSNSASIFTVIQEQLGLKLELRVAPVAILVIDHAMRVPKD
jgi:uncharacterized protein (TIGR03435 family)